MSSEIVTTEQPDDPNIVPSRGREMLPDFLREGHKGQFWASWDARTESDRIELANAKMGGADLLEDAVPGTFMISKAVLHPWDKVDAATGEVIRLIRCVLITEDGKLYSCSSGPIRDAILMIASVFGPGPWEPAVPLEIGRKPLEGGKSTYRVKVLARAPKKVDGTQGEPQKRKGR